MTRLIPYSPSPKRSVWDCGGIILRLLNNVMDRSLFSLIMEDI
jgi:hypothetical protein